jgi:hypothetical protein
LYQNGTQIPFLANLRFAKQPINRNFRGAGRRKNLQVQQAAGAFPGMPPE